MRLPAAFAALACLALPALGDVVHLRNGGSIEGQIVTMPTGVIVKLPSGDIAIPSDTIARIEKKDEKTVVIREIPYSTTTESLIASIEAAAQKGKVKVASIDDFTTDKVEIEIGLSRGCYADEVIPQLYVYTDCEVSISSNLVMIRDKRPVELPVTDTLKFLSSQLRDQIGAELEYELEQLKKRQFWLTLERIFIEKRIYKKIENATTPEQVKLNIYNGLKPFFELLEHHVDDDDIRKLLEIPIRRISQYDIEKNKREIEDTLIAISEVEAKLAKLTQTTIKYLKELIKKYRDLYPRRTEVVQFEAVDVRAVARQDLKVGYDPDTGFFGTEVKGTALQFTVSEYERFLVICKDGSFRIIGPETKTLIPDKVAYIDLFDQQEGKRFTVVYRDSNKISFAKKVHIKRFIRDREYELIKDKKGTIDYLLPGDSADSLQLEFVPAKRQRVKNALFGLGSLVEISASARGSRMAPKPVAKIKVLRGQAAEPVDSSAPAPEEPPEEETRGEKSAEEGKPKKGGSNGSGQISLF